jgi:hypothetical protein
MRLQHYLISIFSVTTVLYATATMDCYWHAAYFDAQFTGNYGTEQEAQYLNDVVARAQVIMQLDSIFRDLRRKGALPAFKRWHLIDSYHESYDYQNGKKLPCTMRIQHDTVYLCMIDSLSINEAMKKLWNIHDIIISPHKRSGIWVYSLHIKTTKSQWYARNYPDTLASGYSRKDEDLLWLRIEGGYSVNHCFYQHEIDGYYHQYAGLYLTKKNTIKAQNLLLKHYGLATTITSQYITPTVLRKYVWY